LFVDGLAERLHLGQPREAVLAAWGITGRGNKVLLGLLPGTKEDTVSCKELLRDLKSRGLVDPLLVVTDGCRFSERRDPSDAGFLKMIPPFGVGISQNLSPL
jgi:transposase-like protein